MNDHPWLFRAGIAGAVLCVVICASTIADALVARPGGGTVAPLPAHRVAVESRAGAPTVAPAIAGEARRRRRPGAS